MEEGQTVFQKAKWIIADTAETDICNRYFEYRTAFDADVTKATKLYISAYSQYVVYVNGRFVDCGQYDDYEYYQVYDILDITPYLKNGKNELYIEHYASGDNFFTRRKQTAGIIFSIRNEEQELLFSSCDVCSRENKHFLPGTEKITRMIGYTFDYDATAEELPYRPSVLAAKEKNLHPRPIKKLVLEPFRATKVKAQGVFRENDRSLPKAKRMYTAYLSACMHDEYIRNENGEVSWKIPEERCADGAYMVFDLEGECTGLLEFSLDVPEETEVLIGFGEHLDDLRVRCAPYERNFCFRCIARKGHNEFFYPYQRIGLKYLQFHVYSGEGHLSAGIRKQTYPLTKYTLPITDKLHQRIYDVGCKTLELCMHEHYEDCPWREQALYAMDSRVEMLCGYYAFREYEFAKASIMLMLRSLRPDHLIEQCAPGWKAITIPCYSAVFLSQLWEYVEYSGDRAILEPIFPEVKKIADAFVERIMENGLVALFDEKNYWNFYEWSSKLNNVHLSSGNTDCLLNAYVSDGLRNFVNICEATGQYELAEQYRDCRRKLNQALHQVYFDEQYGAYRSLMSDEKPRHMLTQGLMLYIDAVPEEWIPSVAGAITSGELIPCSLNAYIYVFDALMRYPEKYSDYVLQEMERIWGSMIFAGADTFWETALGADDFSKVGSLCHGWSAVPVYVFGKYFYKQ